MPRGDKSSYSSKQKRQAEHIEEGYEKHGTSVNKQDKGGKRAAADAEKHPAMQAPAKADEKVAKRRRNRDRVAIQLEFHTAKDRHLAFGVVPDISSTEPTDQAAASISRVIGQRRSGGKVPFFWRILTSFARLLRFDRRST